MRKTLSLIVLLIGCGTVYTPRIPTHYEGERIEVRENHFVRKVQTTYHDGVYTIEYSSSWVGQFTPEVQDFIFQHERGHIELDHMREFGYNPRHAEYNADCYAGRILRDEHDVDDLSGVEQFLRESVRPRRDEQFRQCMEDE